MDPDYTPSGSVDSQSEMDSEDEYIEERARRARDRPVSPAKPGEGVMVPVTTVKQEPVDDGAPRWAPIPDTATVSGPPLNDAAPRWSSIMEAVESSNAGAAIEVPSWASVNQPSSTAPRSEPMNEPSGTAGPTSGSAGPTSGQSDLIVVESSDGVKLEYIIKSEVVSSEDEAEAPPFQQLSQGNAVAAAAIPVEDGVVDSDSLFTKDELCL